MTHEPISTPIDSRRGVHGTSGRAPAVPPTTPPLDEEANRLLEVAAAGRLHFVKFAEVIVANPSRSGVQALAHLAWSFREQAGELYPAKAADAALRYDSLLDGAGALEKAVKTCTAMLDAKDAEARQRMKVAEGIVGVYAAGVSAGQAKAKHELEAEQAQPVLERRVEFIKDNKDRITGKVEREYKTGGKS